MVYLVGYYLSGSNFSIFRHRTMGYSLHVYVYGFLSKLAKFWY